MKNRYLHFVFFAILGVLFIGCDSTGADHFKMIDVHSEQQHIIDVGSIKSIKKDYVIKATIELKGELSDPFELSFSPISTGDLDGEKYKTTHEFEGLNELTIIETEWYGSNMLLIYKPFGPQLKGKLEITTTFFSMN